MKTTRQHIREKISSTLERDIENLTPRAMANLTGITDVSKNARVKEKWLDYALESPKTYTNWMDSWEDFLIRKAIPFDDSGRIRNPQTAVPIIMRESKNLTLKDIVKESHEGLRTWKKAVERISNPGIPDLVYSTPMFNVMITTHGEIGVTEDNSYAYRLYFVFGGFSAGKSASDLFVFESTSTFPSHEVAKNSLLNFTSTIKIKK